MLSLQSQSAFPLQESEAEGWGNFRFWHFAGWRAEPIIEFGSLQCAPALAALPNSFSLLLLEALLTQLQANLGQPNITFFLCMFFMQLQLMILVFTYWKPLYLCVTIHVVILSSGGRFSVIPMGNVFISWLLQIPCCNGNLCMGNMSNRY